MSEKYNLLISEVKDLQRALLTEKQESLLQYQAFTSTATIHQKKIKGLTWHPLLIKEQGYGLGDYPYLIVERTKLKGSEHQFSSGKPVEVFLLNNQKEEESIQGTIHFVNGDVMKITFMADDLPYWIGSGSIGVTLLFDEKSFLEMEKALDLLISTKDEKLQSLAMKILGHQPCHEQISESYQNENLNPSQNKAVSQILSSKDVAVVHGPPGTGKTTTLIQAIVALQKREKQMLVCAPSNAATDLLTEKLADAGLNVVRIGNIARVQEKVIECTLDHQLSHHSQAKDIKRLKKDAAEYRNMATKYKRNFGREEREQRKLMLREAKQIAQEATRLEDYLLEDILEKADIITCTLVGANHRYLDGRLFKTVIIDEAAQALEPASWIPIIKSEKVVFAGDPLQLPPTVMSDKAKKNWLDVTLMEKCLQRISNINLLDTQYRMNEVIMGFSNQQFYANELKADESVKNSALLGHENVQLEYIDTAGCGFDEKHPEESSSLFNEGEFDIIQKHLNNLLEAVAEPFSVGIISPYKAQVEHMTNHFSEELLLTHDITINTIDSFQGQERDVIYISMVRSNDRSEIGFLKDFRRMNVAMTRAKKKLIVIGDSATIGSEKFYTDFLDYVELNNAYRSAWEWMG